MSYGITDTSEVLGTKNIFAKVDGLYSIRGTIASGQGAMVEGSVLSLTADGTKYKLWGGAAVTDIAVTFTASTSTVGKSAHGYTDGMLIYFSAITSTTGIVANANYYIVNATTDTFQVSHTIGGAPLTLTTNGTGVMVIPADTDVSTIDAILGENVDATSADVTALIYVQGQFNTGNLIATTGQTITDGAYKNGNLIFISEA